MKNIDPNRWLQTAPSGHIILVIVACYLIYGALVQLIFVIVVLAAIGTLMKNWKT